jgi:hypothetical protein
VTEGERGTEEVRGARERNKEIEGNREREKGETKGR